MTVREMIEALQALEMPDALVMRETIPRSYYVERGDNWDIVLVSQRRNSLSPSQWFDHRGPTSPELADPNETIKWGVVI